VSTIKAGSETFGLTTMTPGDTPREQLDLEAAAIYRLFAAREREFGFGPNVVVEYPPLGEPPASGFLADPAGHIAARVAEIEKDGPIGRIVVLTTFGRDLMGPLSGAGYTPQRIDMPAGPDHTYAFTLDRDVGTAADGRLLYLEAVDEADEKIRPTFVLKLLDGTGRLNLKAAGGSPPYTWLVDGTPVTEPQRRRETQWQPRGKGFMRISVIDATGASESVSVRLQ